MRIAANVVLFLFSSGVSAILLRYLNVGFSGFGFDTNNSGPIHIWGGVVGVFCMLLGIICGTFYDFLGPGDARISRTDIYDALASRKMARAFLVSPVVLFALLPKLQEVQDLLLVMMFSFQNGFFWQKAVGAGSNTILEHDASKL